MSYPDFIGIGAQKAGTTWLFQNLQAHPQVYMPRKELHYFDQKIEDGSGALMRLFGKRKADGEWRRQARNRVIAHLTNRPSLEALTYDFRYYAGRYDDRWYASLFEAGREKVSGEITPAYSVLGKEKVAHVYGIMPEAKLIFMMRNPIERAWSQTVMSFDKREERPAEHIPERKLLKRFVRDSTRLLTDYRRTLQNWGAFYPEEQIFVGFLEDVALFPEDLLESVYSFLGVDPAFEPPASKEKVHTRSSGIMPARIATYLAQEYREETGRLADLFGGYAAFWSYCVRRLVKDPPERESVPYPQWESELWEQWIVEGDDTSGQPAFQSGPLVSLKVGK